LEDIFFKIISTIVFITYLFGFAFTIACLMYFMYYILSRLCRILYYALILIIPFSLRRRKLVRELGRPGRDTSSDCREC